MTQGTESKSPDESVHTVMVENQHEMLRYLTRRLGNRDEAADVLQNFYVKVLRRIGDVRDTEKLRGWMRRVLETTLIDYFRAQGKRRESETNYHDLETAGFFGNDDEYLDVIVCACLYKLLPTLKPVSPKAICGCDYIVPAKPCGSGWKKPAGPALSMAISIAAAATATNFAPKSSKTLPNCNESLPGPSNWNCKC